MKKCNYLKLFLFTIGMASVFTGCIDTDEPTGISELRGAKSELIKAQATLELAKVAHQEAETAMQMAKVEYQQIENQIRQLDLREKELVLELQEATNEQQIAQLNFKTDSIAKAKELLAEQHKESMLIAQKATAKAQQSYDNAVKAIEAASLLLTTEEQLILTKALLRFGIARELVEDAYDDLVEAQRTYQNALLFYAGSNIQDSLQLNVDNKQFELEAQELIVAKWESLLEKDATTDWDNELAAIKEEIEDLSDKYQAALLEKIQLEEANIQGKIAYEDLYSDYNDLKKKSIDFPAYSNVVENAVVISALNTNGSTLPGYSNGEFSWKAFSFTYNEYEEYVKAPHEDQSIYQFIETVNGWSELITKIGVTDLEALAQKTIQLQLNRTEEAKLKEAEAEAVAEWEEARDAYMKLVEEEADAADIADAKDELKDKSEEAFGSFTTLNYKGQEPRLTHPTDEDILALLDETYSYADFGAVGERLALTVECDLLEIAIAQYDVYIGLAKDFDALLSSFYQEVDDIKAEVELAYEKYEEAKETYDTLFTDINKTINEYKTLIRAYEELEKDLDKLIRQYWYISNNDTNIVEGHVDIEYPYNSLEEAFTAKLLKAREGLVEAQGALERAQKELKMYENKEYTREYALNQAKLEFDTAMDTYESVQAIYDSAYATLQEMISVLLN